MKRSESSDRTSDAPPPATRVETLGVPLKDLGGNPEPEGGENHAPVLLDPLTESAFRRRKLIILPLIAPPVFLAIRNVQTGRWAWIWCGIAGLTYCAYDWGFSREYTKKNYSKLWGIDLFMAMLSAVPFLLVIAYHTAHLPGTHILELATAISLLTAFMLRLSTRERIGTFDLNAEPVTSGLLLAPVLQVAGDDGVVIRYHPHSELSLGPIGESEEDLAAIFRNHGIAVESYPEERVPVAPGSEVPSEVSLVILITGGLVAKTLGQEIVKDLYAYFKGLLRRRMEKKKDRDVYTGSGIHYGLIIDIVSDKGHSPVAVTFRDEESLTIGMYRLVSYIEMLPTQASIKRDDGRVPVDFSYPSAPGIAAILLVVNLFFMAVVLAGLLWWLWSDLVWLLPWLRPVSRAGGAATIALAMYLLACIVGVGIPKYRELRFRKRYTRASQDWARRILN